MARIRANAAFYLWLALGLLLLPFSWLIAAATAAGFHELCHWAAAKWRNVYLHELSLDSGGMVMELGPTTRTDSILISAAGPAGSLLLGCLLHIWPQVAVCGIVQGLYNLFPLYPLDGGRILHALMGERAEWIAVPFVLIIVGLGIVAAERTELGITAIFLVIVVCARAIQRKFPCNAA